MSLLIIECRASRNRAKFLGIVEKKMIRLKRSPLGGGVNSSWVKRGKGVHRDDNIALSCERGETQKKNKEKNDPPIFAKDSHRVQLSKLALEVDLSCRFELADPGEPRFS